MASLICSRFLKGRPASFQKALNVREFCCYYHYVDKPSVMNLCFEETVIMIPADMSMILIIDCTNANNNHAKVSALMPNFGHNFSTVRQVFSNLERNKLFLFKDEEIGVFNLDTSSKLDD